MGSSRQQQGICDSVHGPYRLQLCCGGLKAATGAEAGPAVRGQLAVPTQCARLVQVVQSSVNKHALVSFDFWNNLESVKTSKRWMKRGVWTCSPLEPFSARVCHFSSTIPQTLPHLWSSDENMSYYMHFCRDQHWSVSLENILLLFISKIIVSLVGNTVPTVLPVCN